MQNIVTSSLAMQQKIIDAFPEKPNKMVKASNKLTIEEAREGLTTFSNPIIRVLS